MQGIKHIFKIQTGVFLFFKIHFLSRVSPASLLMLLRFQMDEEFDVSALASERAGYRRLNGETRFFEFPAGLGANVRRLSAIEHYPAWGFFPVIWHLRQFVVRLEQRDDIASVGQPASSRRDDKTLRREGCVDNDQIDLFVRGVGVECVCPLHHDDALVFSEFPRQFAVSGIDGEDLRGSALQQAIGEPPDVSAEIGAGQTGDIQSEGIEGGVKFLPPTGCESTLQRIPPSTTAPNGKPVRVPACRSALLILFVPELTGSNFIQTLRQAGFLPRSGLFVDRALGGGFIQTLIDFSQLRRSLIGLTRGYGFVERTDAVLDGCFSPAINQPAFFILSYAFLCRTGMCHLKSLLSFLLPPQVAREVNTIPDTNRQCQSYLALKTPAHGEGETPWAGGTYQFSIVNCRLAILTPLPQQDADSTEAQQAKRRRLGDCYLERSAAVVTQSIACGYIISTENQVRPFGTS